MTRSRRGRSSRRLHPDVRQWRQFGRRCRFLQIISYDMIYWRSDRVCLSHLRCRFGQEVSWLDRVAQGHSPRPKTVLVDERRDHRSDGKTLIWCEFRDIKEGRKNEGVRPSKPNSATTRCVLIIGNTIRVRLVIVFHFMQEFTCVAAHRRVRTQLW